MTITLDKDDIDDIMEAINDNISAYGLDDFANEDEEAVRDLISDVFDGDIDNISSESFKTLSSKVKDLLHSVKTVCLKTEEIEKELNKEIWDAMIKVLKANGITNDNMRYLDVMDINNDLFQIEIDDWSSNIEELK